MSSCQGVRPGHVREIQAHCLRGLPKERPSASSAWRNGRFRISCVCSKRKGIARRTGNNPLGARFAGLLHRKTAITVHLERHPASTVHSERRSLAGCAWRASPLPTDRLRQVGPCAANRPPAPDGDQRHLPSGPFYRRCACRAARSIGIVYYLPHAEGQPSPCSPSSRAHWRNERSL